MTKVRCDSTKWSSGWFIQVLACWGTLLTSYHGHGQCGWNDIHAVINDVVFDVPSVHGYLNCLIIPLSSAVTISVRLWLRATALMSLPSCPLAHIPCTGNPRIHVHVCQSVSLREEALFTCRPVVLFQNNNS